MARKKWPARDLIVKVQRQLGVSAGKFLVYDRAKTIYQELPFSEELHEAMNMDAKVYFRAHISAEGFLTIGRRAKWQDW